jgi:hypothetical protein
MRARSHRSRSGQRRRRIQSDARQTDSDGLGGATGNLARRGRYGGEGPDRVRRGLAADGKQAAPDLPAAAELNDAKTRTARRSRAHRSGRSAGCASGSAAACRSHAPGSAASPPGRHTHFAGRRAARRRQAPRYMAADQQQALPAVRNPERGLEKGRHARATIRQLSATYRRASLSLNTNESCCDRPALQYRPF